MRVRKHMLIGTSALVLAVLLVVSVARVGAEEEGTGEFEIPRPHPTLFVAEPDLTVHCYESFCNAYFLTDTTTGKFVVIDPTFALWPLVKRHIDRGNELVGIWITHEHGDHVTGLGELLAQQKVPVFAHVEVKKAMPETRENWEGWVGGAGAPPPPDPDTLVEDGDTLHVGDLEVQAHFAPGHSRGSIMFLLPGRFLFAGDVLFKGSIGRTDLETSDPALFQKSLAATCWDLPSELVVLSGHMEKTTIGAEKATNWLLQDYVRAGRGLEPLPRPWMGIQINPEREGAGIELAVVVEGSPAEGAGLKIGDVITEFAGVPIVTIHDLIPVLRRHAIGDQVELKIERAGERQSLDMVVGSLPR